jgi:oligopeptide/dipeptide ABC transporter ATP-binding protein
VTLTWDKTRGPALDELSFRVAGGDTLVLAGPSGSGKSSVIEILLGFVRPDSGRVTINGADITDLVPQALSRLTAWIGQRPVLFAGTIRDNIRFARPEASDEDVDAAAKAARVEQFAALLPSGLDTRIGEGGYGLSGGQAQRVAIARAVALEPSLLICDEAVSSLDVLIQAQVLNLFEKLRRELGLSYLFIAHDLALVKQVSDRVGVMYLGKFCEVGPGESVYKQPLHPYTKALLDSIPSTEPGAGRTTTLRGEPPSPIDPPSGCRFRTRCPRAADRCAEEVPEPRELFPGHLVACHFPLTEAVEPAAAPGVPAAQAALPQTTKAVSQ